MRCLFKYFQYIKGDFHSRHTSPVFLIGAVIIGLTGCVTDRQPDAALPRDLVADISVQADRAPKTGPTRIGVMLPLSGPHADVGQQLWNSAVLSLFDSGQTDIVLAPRDTQGTPAGAIAAAEMAASNGDDLVIGPLFSTSVSATRPILERYGLRGLALSNNSAEARAPYFLIGNHPENQIDALAAYLDSTGRRRIKLFGPDTHYIKLLRDRLVQLDKTGKIQLIDSRVYRNGASYTDIAKEVRAVTIYDKRANALKDFTGIFAAAWEKFDDPEEALQAALEKLEDRVEAARLQLASFTPNTDPLPQQPGQPWGVTVEEFDTALSDILTIYRRHEDLNEDPRDAMEDAITEFEQRETLGSVDFDVVLVPIGGRPLLVIAPMFEYFNAQQPDVWLLGTDIWEDTVRRNPKDLIGSRFVSARTDGWQTFQSQYQEAYGTSPATIAATAFDAIRIVISEKNETGAISLSQEFLTRPAGFEGVNGRIWFNFNGRNKRALSVLELTTAGPRNVFTAMPERNFYTQDPLNTDPQKIMKDPQLKPPFKPSPSPPISSLQKPENKRS